MRQIYVIEFSNIVLERHERRVLFLFTCSKKGSPDLHIADCLSLPHCCLNLVNSLSHQLSCSTKYSVSKMMRKGVGRGSRTMFGSIKYDKLGERKCPLYVYFVNANGKYILHWSHPYWSYQSDMSFSSRLYMCVQWLDQNDRIAACGSKCAPSPWVCQEVKMEEENRCAKMERNPLEKFL